MLNIKLTILNIVGLISLLFIAFVSADTQRFLDYEYDGAGNIISVQSGVNLGPPDVTNLSPAFVNKESFSFITATGINLLKVDVTTTTPGLSIVGINNISETEVRFRLIADSTAVIGPGALTFSTRLGADVETVVIAERTPVISTEPNPILLEPDSQVKEVKLLFDQPFTTDQVYDVLIRDESIASVSEQSITLLAGEREVAVNVTGFGVGNTSLEINQFSNFLALAIPVIVADPFQLPPGNQFIASKPFGVTVSRFNLPLGSNKIISKPFGVLRNSFDLPLGNNKIISQAFGVLRNSFDLPLGNNKIISQAFGVLRNSFDLPASQNNVLSQPFGVTASNFELPVGDNRILSDVLGVTLEPVAEQVSPSQIARGTTNTLTITGVSLDAVTNINFAPGADITQTAPFSVNAAGTELSIFIDATASAAIGLRQIILDSANGQISFSVPNGQVFEITN